MFNTKIPWHTANRLTAHRLVGNQPNAIHTKQCFRREARAHARTLHSFCALKALNPSDIFIRFFLCMLRRNFGFCSIRTPPDLACVLLTQVVYCVVKQTLNGQSKCKMLVRVA